MNYESHAYQLNRDWTIQEEANKEMPRIMIVDDDPTVVSIVTMALGDSYVRIVANNGRQALNLLHSTTTLPDLILLDFVMPEMDGSTTLIELKRDPKLREIPVIILSAWDDVGSIEWAFQNGCSDYITKPFEFKEVVARVKLHLGNAKFQNRLLNRNSFLNQEVDRKVSELLDAQMAVIFALAKLAEYRDDDTHTHLDRVQRYCRILLLELIRKMKDSTEITHEYINLVSEASILHDIGKVGIPDSILLKPAKLTSDEFEIMKTHTLIGAQTLRQIWSRFKGNRFLEIGIEIANFHHEKWDGSGYPTGCEKEKIPLSARVVAIADVYDALRSRRVYKSALPHEQVVDMIKQLKGTHFDPMLVDVFLETQDKFQEVFDKNSSEPILVKETKFAS